MRDKERIPRIINKLEETWKEYPDWRLGQLIANISIEIRNEDNPFYLSDDDLEQFLDSDNPDYWNLKEEQNEQ